MHCQRLASFKDFDWSIHLLDYALLTGLWTIPYILDYALQLTGLRSEPTSVSPYLAPSQSISAQPVLSHPSLLLFILSHPFKPRSRR